MTIIVDGIYAVRMAGQDGQGFSMFVLQGGIVIGADPLGVLFDGSYHPSDDQESFEVDIQVTVPPNGSVIQGASAGPSGLSYTARFTLHSDFSEQDYVRIETPLGPVNANFRRLRPLEASSSDV